MTMASHGHSHHDHVVATAKKPRRRKRKAPQSFYGYDPTIQVIPGDPRLAPPPGWFRVNYHASQPVNNAWLNWNGSEVELFDISTNKTVPTSKDTDIRRDEHRRKKRRYRMLRTFRARVKKEIMLPMELHPPQPIHNSWMDWDWTYDENVEDQDKSEEESVDSRNPSPVPSTSSTSTRNPSPVAFTSKSIAVTKPLKDPTPEPLPINAKMRNNANENETKVLSSAKVKVKIKPAPKTLNPQPLSKGHAPDVEMRNASKPTVNGRAESGAPQTQGGGGKAAAKPQNVVNINNDIKQIKEKILENMMGTINGKSVAQGTEGAAASQSTIKPRLTLLKKKKVKTEKKRTKQLQLINRVRKQIYKNSLEVRISHMESFVKALKVGLNDVVTGLTCDSVDEKKNDVVSDSNAKEVKELKWMISEVLRGNGTFSYTNHSSCSHESVEYDKIILETLKNVQVEKNKRIKDAKDLEFLAELEGNKALWENLIKEAQADVESRRLKVLFTAQNKDKETAANISLQGLSKLCSELTNYTSSMILLTKTVSVGNSIDQVGQLGAGQVKYLGQELVDFLGLEEDQITRISSLNQRQSEEWMEEKVKLDRLLLELKILERIIKSIWKICLIPPIEQTDKLFKGGNFTKKQMDKILFKAADWENHNQEISSNVKMMVENVSRLDLSNSSDQL